MNDVDTLQPGLETDILIAERALGWKKAGQPCQKCFSQWRPHYERAGLSNCLPRFSADMNAALEVWETVFPRREVCLRKGPEPGEHAWCVADYDPDHFHESIAYAPTPALAVCRAALHRICKNP